MAKYVLAVFPALLSRLYLRFHRLPQPHGQLACLIWQLAHCPVCLSGIPASIEWHWDISHWWWWVVVEALILAVLGKEMGLGVGKWWGFKGFYPGINRGHPGTGKRLDRQEEIGYWRPRRK